VDTLKAISTGSFAFGSALAAGSAHPREESRHAQEKQRPRLLLPFFLSFQHLQTGSTAQAIGKETQWYHTPRLFC
jgi:hypothetical protein